MHAFERLFPSLLANAGRHKTCPYFAASRSGRETLLRKASETTAHVAGFGFHSKDCGPSSILGFIYGLMRRLCGAGHHTKAKERCT